MNCELWTLSTVNFECRTTCSLILSGYSVDSLSNALCANNQTTRATRAALMPLMEFGHSDRHAELARLVPDHERVRAHQVRRTFLLSASRECSVHVSYANTYERERALLVRDNQNIVVRNAQIRQDQVNADGDAEMETRVLPFLRQPELSPLLAPLHDLPFTYVVTVPTVLQ